MENAKYNDKFNLNSGAEFLRLYWGKYQSCTLLSATLDKCMCIIEYDTRIDILNRTKTITLSNTIS